MSFAYANVYASNIWKTFFCCIWIAHMKAAPRIGHTTIGVSPDPYLFCWFRRAQSATRRYLDELRGSRQIPQLHVGSCTRWAHMAQAHAMRLCEMRLVGILCLWKLFAGLHVLLAVPGLVWKTRLWIFLVHKLINVWVQYFGCQFSVYATKEDSFSFDKVKQE
jgi:hypothetical protein